MEMYEVKSCPFCGGMPIVTTARYCNGTHNFDFKAGNIPQHTIVCSKCNMYFGFNTRRGGTFFSKYEAVNAWNKRVNSESQRPTKIRAKD